MKYLILLLFFFMVSSEAISQNNETRKLSSFDKVSVGQSIKLVLKKGDENKALIETRGVATDRVLTEISGSSLKIHMKNGNYNSISVEVYLTYAEELVEIKCSSSAVVKSFEKMTSRDLSLHVSSSAKLDLDVETEELEISVSSSGKANLNVDTQDLSVGVSSSGKLMVSGTTNFQNFDISSSGRYRAFELNSQKVKANVSSSGSAEIQVAQELIANASSSGRISYRGNPEKVLIDSRSGGRVRNIN